MQGSLGGAPALAAKPSSPSKLLDRRCSFQPSRRLPNTLTTCSAQTLTPSYTGTRTAPPKGGHHFLHIDDFSKEQLSAMLATARTVKDRILLGENQYKPFAGKTMAMIFTKPSMRTRVSFETVSHSVAVGACMYGEAARACRLTCQQRSRASLNWEVMQSI